jgi:hypothetical protein
MIREIGRNEKSKMEHKSARAQEHKKIQKTGDTMYAS